VFDKREDEKYQVDWVYITHDHECDIEKMISNISSHLDKGKGELWFKMEPPIVSIHCRNIQSTGKLLSIAKECGLKNCGIRSISPIDGSAMLTLVDTHHIEALVAADGKSIITVEYLKLLTDRARTKLIVSRERFEKVRLEFQKKLDP